ELIESGLHLSLRAFEYRVLWDLREVVDSPRRPWAQLERELGGRGVPSIEQAIVDQAYRAVHKPLFEAINAGSTNYLAELARAIDASVALATAVEEKLTNIVAGLKWMGTAGMFAGDPSVERELTLPDAL